MRTLFRSSLSMFGGLIFILLLSATTVCAQGYGPTDFIIADKGLDRIAVYDRNMVFKRYLDTGFRNVTGLDFFSNGHLVAVGQNQDVKIYGPGGVRGISFIDARVGQSIDIKVGPSNLLYIPTDDATAAVSEFTLIGAYNRQIGSYKYNSLAVLPGGVMWAAGHVNGIIDVYNISTGIISTSIKLDNGQVNASSMYYSPATNTVLTTDAGTGQVFERTPAGAFIRTFIPPPGITPYSFGVTRGPGGDVLATYFVSQRVVRWRADGTLLSNTDVSAHVSAPINIVWAGNARLRAVRSDFDGDFRTDYAIWKPSDGNWFAISTITGPILLRRLGIGGDVPVPGDYDGDYKTDLAVWRPSEGNWYIINSSDGSITIRGWGRSGDIAVPGDYDGDNRTDLAVWRPSEGYWYIQPSSSSSPIITGWGMSGDKPVQSDYDGDGRTDLAVWRPSEGNWYVTTSASGTYFIFNWGAATDKPVPADYDGDGKTDIAIWRPSDGLWAIIGSGGGGGYGAWGASGDMPVPADYDGDGLADIAVWRPSDGRWYVVRSHTRTVTVVSFGVSGDVAVPNAYLPQ